MIERDPPDRPAAARRRPRRRTARGALLVALFTIVRAVPGTAASPVDVADPALVAAYEASGIGVHLAAIAETVRTETSERRASCAAPPALEPLAPAALERRALGALARTLSADDVVAVARFHRSPAGGRVVAAERASGALDEATFERLRRAVAASPGWTPERRARLRAVLHATRAGELVAALNGGIVGAIEAAGSCGADAGELERLSIAAASMRGESAFHGFFLVPTLIDPSGVVFRELGDEDLDAFAAFAATPAGGRWYAALVAATSESLAWAHGRLVSGASRPPDEGTSGLPLR